MRITDVKTCAVANARPSRGGRFWVFLKLVTDDGIEGIGEVYAAAFGPETIRAMIRNVAERHLVGSDPFRIEQFWRCAYGRGYSLRPEISLLAVISGLEMACRDIIGEKMARVAGATSIPVATGERLATRHEFARVLEFGAASILQLNFGRAGGLLEAKKIAGTAEARYAQIASHLYCGPVVGAANIQLAACSPDFLILESIFDWSGFSADVLVRPIRWEDSYVTPPNDPGLGVEIDEDVLEAHPYTGSELRLEALERPYPDPD